MTSPCSPLSRRLLAVIAGCLWMSGPASAAAPADVPPTQVLTIDVAGATASDLKESRSIVDRQSDTLANFTYIQRHAWESGSPFYFSYGARGETYNFDNVHGFRVRQLQDYGGQFSLEYFLGSEIAAYITVRPGFYFEEHPNTSSWDIPFEAATGIPITPSLNGVIGATYGRLWRNVLPIAGLSWTINPKTRLDLIFPNPSLVYNMNNKVDARLTGELLGTSFRTDASPDQTVTTFYIYRLGANLDWKCQPGLKLITGAGVEVMRDFQFWRDGHNYQSSPAPYIRLGLEWSR